MTITPLDFAAITGLRVGGDPIPFDSGLFLDRAAVRHFLGRDMGDEPSVRCDHLPAIWDHEPESAEEARQMARAYLLYLFGSALFPGRKSHVHLGWLPALADLGTAGRFDWGGAALCTLYVFLGSVVRGGGTKLGGYWRVLEVWAYEVFGVPAPKNSHPNKDVFPRAEKWAQQHVGKGAFKGDLRGFRLFLDQSVGATVHWNVWGRWRQPYLTQSREMTRGGVLLESPYGWQWYLGERVLRQSLGIDFFRVPGPLPSRVQRTHEYTSVEVEAYTVLDVQLVFDPSLDYAGYVRSTLAHSLDMERRLVEPVPTAAASLPVLRREIDVMTADGGMGIIDVPTVTGPVTLAATEIPVEWASSQVQLIRDLEALVRRLMLGDRPEVRPRPEPGVVQDPGGGGGDGDDGDGGEDGAGGRHGGRAGRGGGRGAGDDHGTRGSRMGGGAGGSRRDRGAGGSRGAGSSGGDRGTGGGGEPSSRRRPRRARRASGSSETEMPPLLHCLGGGL